MQRYYSRHHRLEVLKEKRDSSLIFNAIPVGPGLFRDSISGGAFAQSYTPTNRNLINQIGVMEAVAANTVPIDHIGASFEPALRLEPAAANILLEVLTDWTDTTLTPVKNAVNWAGAANGAYTVTASGATGTLISSAVTATSAAFTFVCAIKRSVGTGAVYMTIDNGSTWTEKTLTSSFQYFNVTKTAANPQLGFQLATSGDAIIVDCLMLVPNTAIASSYFAPAAAIGAELVTDGGFDAVTEGAELATGLLTIGNCYKITARTDGDFIAAGAPDNNVNTYFNATTTGVGLLDAGDKVKPITFTSWTVGAGWAPQATAGALTGKVQKIAGAAGAITQNNILSTSKVYREAVTITRTAGTANLIMNGYIIPDPAIVADGTYYIYRIAGTGSSTGIWGEADFVGTIDDVSAKEHGTVRLSEANTTTLAIPAAVAAALAATGTIVIKGRFAFARAAGVVTGILTSDTTNKLIYTTTTAGNVSSDDATTVTETTGAYTANTDWKIALKFPSSANKYRIGIDVAGAGIAWAAETNFDGAFPVAANLIIGHILHGATWTKWIKIHNKILTDPQINAMN